MKHPIVAIHSAGTHVELAKILLEAPLLLLVGSPVAFYVACEAAGFEDGLAYLDAVRAALVSHRPYGEFGSMALNGALSRLRYLVHGGEA